MFRSLCSKLVTSRAHGITFCGEKRTLSSSLHHCAPFSGDEFQRPEDDELEKLLDDKEYLEIVPHNLLQTPDVQNVFLVQPRLKWGSLDAERLSNTTPELQLEEAVALIETIDNWRVVDKVLMTLQAKSFKKRLFGEGALEKLAQVVSSKQHVSALFVGVDILTGHQQAEIEDAVKVPVYDRYSVVLQIFNSRATSKETRLQVALAEIPYIRSRLRELTKRGKDRAPGTRGHIAGSGESHFALRQRLLEERARKLRAALDKLKANRSFLRERRKKLHIPVVAVVGYTNCGKTTLIKNLTRDERMTPRNHLFATLDVTLHTGMLPTLKQVLYVDTVGFISNIPNTLIEAFKSTLQEVTMSDLVIHVQDVSHPDIKWQHLTVSETLRDIEVSDDLRALMLQVGNKVDKVEDPATIPVDSDMLISAVQGTNIAELKIEIEKRLIAKTGQRLYKFRVSSGGEESRWLYKNASIHTADADPDDNNFLIVTALINTAMLGKFRRLYGDELILEVQAEEESVKSCSQ